MKPIVSLWFLLLKETKRKWVQVTFICYYILGALATASHCLLEILRIAWFHDPTLAFSNMAPIGEHVHRLWSV